MATQKRKKNDPERLPCNECHKKTRHDLLKQVSDTVLDDVDIGGGDTIELLLKTTNQIFECRGCKSVMLRRIAIYSLPERPDSVARRSVKYFPPPVARQKPKWFGEIPDDLQRLMSEIYNSLDADTRALPMMGARAVLDAVIVDKVGDVGRFDEKLRALEADQHISSKGRRILEAALDAGNAAAHRGYAPPVTLVNSVMDIVENLVHSIYILDKVAEEIKQSTPPRTGNKKVQK